MPNANTIRRILSDLSEEVDFHEAAGQDESRLEGLELIRQGALGNTTNDWLLDVSDYLP